MKSDRKPRLTEGLNGSSLTEHTSAGWNQNVLAAVRVHRVGDETIHGRGSAAIEPVSQHRVDDGSLEEWMERPGRTDCRRPVWRAVARGRCRAGAAFNRSLTLAAGCGCRRRPHLLSTSRADDRVGDLLERGESRAHGIATNEGAATSNPWTQTLRLWTPAEHHVARKEALVLATLAIGHDRILRGRRGRVSDRLLDGRGWRRGLSILSLAGFHGAQTLLVITQTIGVRRQWRRHRWRWRRRPLWLPRDENDQDDTDRYSGHQPSLEAARQHASWNWAMVGDGRRSSGFRLFGHRYRPCCSKVNRWVPSMR
jgi:hypothetical protein